MPRLIHTADWQIGRTYGRFDDEAAGRLAGARYEVVGRIATLATQRRADAILVAGDVFDAQGLSDVQIRRLFHRLAGFAGPWVLIPGNHDAALAESIWTRARRLDCIPANAHVIERPTVLPLPAAGIAIIAAPLTQRQTREDLTAWFDEAETPPGLLRIGLAHGAVQGVLAPDIDSANPIAADRAERARLDYLALGDWHGMKAIDARTWYSGTPEPDRFRNNAAGQVLVVDLAANEAADHSAHQSAHHSANQSANHAVNQPPIVEAVAVAGHRWQSVDWTYAVPSDLDQLETQLAALTDQDVLAITLAGRLDLETRRALQRLLDIAESRVAAFDADWQGIALAPTEADLAALAADGYVAEALATLRAGADSDPVDARAFELLAGLLSEVPR